MKRGPSKQHALNDNQTQALLRVCTELEDRVLIKLMLLLGLRIGEVLHLHLSWIKEGEIRIPSKQECSCSLCADRGYWAPKTKAGIRSLPLPRVLADDLRAFLGHQPKGFNGLTKQALWHRVKRLCYRAGIRRKGLWDSTVSPEDLRATAALRFSAHLTAAELCYILGKSRIEMDSHYVHLASVKPAAISKSKAVLGG